MILKKGRFYHGILLVLLCSILSGSIGYFSHVPVDGFSGDSLRIPAGHSPTTAQSVSTQGDRGNLEANPYQLEETYTMMNAKQLREMITETLKDFDEHVPFSENVVELLLMTAAHESHLGTYLRQVKGPARGIFQMEPNTEKDLWVNYLTYKPEMAAYIDKYRTGDPESDLQYNLKYQILMARVFYRRIPAALPTTTEGHAEYAKKYWNTYLGAATVTDYSKAYLNHVVNQG